MGYIVLHVDEDIIVIHLLIWPGIFSKLNTNDPTSSASSNASKSCVKWRLKASLHSVSLPAVRGALKSGPILTIDFKPVLTIMGSTFFNLVSRGVEGHHLEPWHTLSTAKVTWFLLFLKIRKLS